MDGTPDYIDVAALTPLFQGRTRAVYALPDRPDALLKVESAQRRASIEEGTGWLKELKRRSPTARYSYLRREMDTYLRAMLRAENLGQVPPLPAPKGLVLTSAGLGALVEKVRDRAGDPAPTLRATIAADGADPALVTALNRLVGDLRAFAIPIHDISADNIVVETWQDRHRCVLVDGFGEKTWVPLGRYLPALNDRRLARQCGDTARAVGLSFDSARFAFGPPLPDRATP